MNSTNSDNFQTISNPYIVGNPIEDRKMFFGREDDFDYIRKKVTGGKKGGLIVLCGTRRSGKTSILFQIKGGRLGGEFLPVLIDMQSMTVQNDKEFLANLARTIISAVGGSKISFDRDFKSREDDNPFTVFQDLIEKINSELQGKKLILMFDEYELFETHIDKGRFSTDILNLLANWMEHKEGVFIIFTGSDRLESRNSRYWEHFLGKALHRRISFLSKNDTLRLIHEPLKGIVNYGEGVPEEIYNLTAGQPFYSQVMCQSLVDHLNENCKYDVTVQDVQQVVTEIIENPLPQMIFSWSSLSDLEKLSLSIIAALSKDKAEPVPPKEILSYTSDEKIGYGLDPNKIREAAERLFHHDLLDKDIRSDSYTFKMDLWRLWVIRMHSIWQVIDEIIEPGRELGEGIMPVERRISRFRIFAFAVAVALIVGLPITYYVTRRDGPGSSTDGRVVLFPDSTLLSVSTHPRGAFVYLDDNYLGKSPVADEKVPVKQAVLTVTLTGYKESKDTLDLRKDESVERTFHLEKLCGSLRITSDPSGAYIYLDGEITGKSTPSTINGLSIVDFHNVKLQLSGYNDATFQAIEIYEDSTREINHPFVIKTSPLKITSEPLGAIISLDGSSYGETPNSLPSVPHGAHVLRLRKKGFEEFRKRINVPASNNLIEVTLKPLPKGKLIFRVNPYATIYINGELKVEYRPNYEIDLEPDIYEIELRHPNFDAVRITHELKPGKQDTIRYDFTEEKDKL